MFAILYVSLRVFLCVNCVDVYLRVHILVTVREGAPVPIVIATSSHNGPRFMDRHQLLYPRTVNWLVADPDV